LKEVANAASFFGSNKVKWPRVDCSESQRLLFKEFIFKNPTKFIGTELIVAEGARLLWDVAGKVRPLNREAVKLAHPRPTESEHLQRKSTDKL